MTGIQTVFGRKTPNNVYGYLDLLPACPEPVVTTCGRTRITQAVTAPYRVCGSTRGASRSGMARGVHLAPATRVSQWLLRVPVVILLLLPLLASVVLSAKVSEQELDNCIPVTQE